jgi:hypothetical protein
MKVELFYAIALCASIVGIGSFGFSVTLGLVRAVMNISSSALGTLEAFNNGDYGKTVWEIGKLALDTILVIGIGRLLDRTRRIPLKLSLAIILLAVLPWSHLSLSGDLVKSSLGRIGE